MDLLPLKARSPNPCKCRSKHSKKKWYSWDLFPEEELDVVVRRQPGRQACANIKESRVQALEGAFQTGSMSAKLAVPRRNDCTGGGIVGWCLGWTSFVYSYKGPLIPQDHEYEEVCKRCSAALFTPVPQDSGSDTDPSHGHRLRSGCLPVPPPPPSLSSFRLLVFSALRLRSSLYLFVTRASTLSQLWAMVK